MPANTDFDFAGLNVKWGQAAGSDITGKFPKGLLVTNLQGLSPGTAGTVLTSNGPGVAPTWTNVSDMTLISTQSALNVATVAFTGLTGYARYRMIGTVTPANTVAIQFGTGGGPTWSTAFIYDYSVVSLVGAAVVSNIANLSNGISIFPVAPLADSSASLDLTFTNLSSATDYKFVYGETNYTTSVPEAAHGWVSGNWTSNTAVTSIRLNTGTNFVHGTVSLFGLNP